MPDALRGLAGWHRVVIERDAGLLDELLADEVVFHSPVVFTPQQGKALTTMYLTGAMHVIANESFRYVREVADGPDAVLEFLTEIDGVTVNGIDMIRFDEDGRIVNFTVMVRPLKGMLTVQAKMAELLAQMQPGTTSGAP
jgi:predicted SnoaL-like aldol condensation-catalyzing enzyme